MIASQPVFVLCAPRSFSSVTIAMLGRHPQLFAVPELNLFVARRLRELIAFEAEFGEHRGYLTGLTRALALIEFGSQNGDAIARAKHWLEEHAEWGTKAVLEWLAQRVAPQRIVDKSPRTSMAEMSCRRALGGFPGAHCLHLLRHPLTAIEAATSTTLDAGPHVNRFFAELWVNCQETVLKATKSLPSSQLLRMRGEDLLQKPEENLRRICEWLDINAGPEEIEAMKHPEDWEFAKPAMGLPDSDLDAGFRANPRLQTVETPPEFCALERLRLGDVLSARVAIVSRELGYA